MLIKLLSLLLKSGEAGKTPPDPKAKKKLTQKEKDALEYKLWEMAEEYKEEE